MNIMKFFWLLCLMQRQLALGLAWKPIVGQPVAPVLANSKATSATYTSAFSLQQTHPEYGSESTAFAAIESKELSNQDTLAAQLTVPVPSSTAVLADKILTVKTPHPSLIIPPAINFEDAKFGYQSLAFSGDQCAVKKYAFNHDGIVEYNNKIPELKQFTICFWMRFTNHSGDHVVLTYSVKDDSRAFQFWVANSKNSSFISMAIKGQQMYRLNYPLRVRQWHHTCTSWNGKTGEWQVWLKAERIGRGFHNSLVNHKIRAGGKLFSGGPSVTGKIAEGLHFEVTLIQIYRIALSAGKAHRDHKHHHAHHFDHDGREIQRTTRPPPPAINRPQSMHSLLANGQIPTRVRINLAQPVQKPNMPATNSLSDQGLSINTNFVNGQINSGSRLVAQQLIGLNQNFDTGPQTSHTFNQQAVYNPNSNANSNVQFIDETETRILFKRNVVDLKKKKFKKRSTSAEKDGKIVKKRGLVLLDNGSVLDDPLLADGNQFKFDGLADFGGQQFKNYLTEHGKDDIEDEISEHDREPAEDEVKAVMSLCSLCEIEPFEGAIVFAWKGGHEQLDNALKGYSVGGCGEF
uniref:Pentraxin (PTX) domain-containing protein n=1 Tax=Glossina austeni TaxID=7395 RepID=A0A1A9VCQ0_GLOAU